MAEPVKQTMFPKDQNEQMGNWINCAFFVARISSALKSSIHEAGELRSSRTGRRRNCAL